MKRAVAPLDRIGSFGALGAAIAAPCCFPLFAAVGTAVGLGALGRYESTVLYLFQAFALLSLAGLAMAFSQHRNPAPLILGVISAGALAYNFYHSFSLTALYSGLFGLFGATGWNYFVSRLQRATGPILHSVITCPKCGHRAEETMPTNACLFFYDCPACEARLKPKAGDCCVFCSYGSVPCVHPRRWGKGAVRDPANT
jgi:MerC mercury resistance protein